MSLSRGKEALGGEEKAVTEGEDDDFGFKLKGIKQDCRYTLFSGQAAQ